MGNTDNRATNGGAGAFRDSSVVGGRWEERFGCRNGNRLTALPLVPVGGLQEDAAE